MLAQDQDFGISWIVRGNSVNIRLYDIKMTWSNSNDWSMNILFSQFSPFAKGSKRYMLSTGTDATVYFWQWDVNNINFR